MIDTVTIQATQKTKTSWSITLLNGEARFADCINLLSAKARKGLTERIVEKFPGLDSVAIADQLEAIAAEQGTKEAEPKPSKAGSATAPPVDRRKLADEMPADVRQAAMDMLKAENLLEQLLSDICIMGVTGERKLAATIYLIGTSRLLSRPVSGIVQGPSTSGKSFIVERIAKLFPLEAIFVATSLTPNALYYLLDGSLSHRWIVAGERSRLENDERAETTRALREMLSCGEITKLVPEKDADGILVTRAVHQTGPIAFVETTTLTRIFDEDSNRCLLLQTDEREGQTKRILLATAESRNSKIDTAPIVAKHHAIQRLLEQLPVQIPFAAELAGKFPCQRTEARRAFGHLLSMIEAVALLHQFQREQQDGAIVATLQDYAIAKKLLAEPMGRLLGGSISAASRRFLERLRSRVSATETWTTREAIKGEPSSNRAVQGWLRELTDSGYLEVVEPARGPKAAVWRIILDAETKGDEGILPDLGVA